MSAWTLDWSSHRPGGCIVSTETQARDVEVRHQGATDTYCITPDGTVARTVAGVPFNEVRQAPLAAAIRRIAELEEERERVRGLLGEVADADPETRDSYEEAMCFFCGAGDWPDDAGARYLNHLEDCLWVRIRASLKGRP